MQYRGRLDEDDPLVAAGLVEVRGLADELVRAACEVVTHGLADPEKPEEVRRAGLALALKSVCNAFYKREDHDVESLLTAFTLTLGTVFANTLRPEGFEPALEHVGSGVLQVAHGEYEMSQAIRSGAPN